MQTQIHPLFLGQTIGDRGPNWNASCRRCSSVPLSSHFYHFVAAAAAAVDKCKTICQINKQLNVNKYAFATRIYTQ